MKKGRLAIRLFAEVALILLVKPVYSQSPVLAFSTTYVSTASPATYTSTPAPNSGSFTNCASSQFGYTFNSGTNNALKLLDIIANGQNYFIVESAPAVVKLQRVNNANVSGNRCIVFLESATAPTSNCPGSMSFTFKSPYRDHMESFLNNNFVNQGTDNIFTNQNNGDGNNNNIERVDVIFPNGLTLFNTTDGGFALFERGNNNAHDGFRIAAITSLDANGDPASFGPVKTCTKGNGSNNGSWGHPSIENGNQNLSVWVARKEGSETQLKTSAAINQQLGGVFFTFADLDVAPSQTIYGYSLLGPDGTANPTSDQLLNINDEAVYPTNTTEAIGGGLDLIAVNAFFSNGAPTLPKLIKEFYGQVSNGKINIKWALDKLPVPTMVHLEYATNGKDFINIYSHSFNSVGHSYQFIHQPRSTTHYYRLKIKTPEGRLFYSNIITIKSPGTTTCKLYPTVVQTKSPFFVDGLKDGLYKAKLFDETGKQVHSISVNVFNSKGMIHQPDEGLQKGTYFILFEDQHQQIHKGGKILIN